MLETIICIILAPVALVAAAAVVAIGIGLVKAIFKKN